MATVLAPQYSYLSLSCIKFLYQPKSDRVSGYCFLVFPPSLHDTLDTWDATDTWDELQTHWTLLFGH